MKSTEPFIATHNLCNWNSDEKLDPATPVRLLRIVSRLATVRVSGGQVKVVPKYRLIPLPSTGGAA